MADTVKLSDETLLNLLAARGQAGSLWRATNGVVYEVRTEGETHE